MRSMRRAGLLLWGVLAVAVCHGAEDARVLRVAIGAKDTPYALVGHETARQAKLLCPACDVQVIETAGGVQNLQMLRDGKLDIGFANTGVAWEASIGVGAFEGKPVPLRALAVLYPHSMHLVVSRQSGISTMSDLKGKRLATGLPGSGTEAVSLRMLRAVGLDPDRDVQRERLGVLEGIQAMKAGKLDGFIFGGAVPVPPIGDFLREGNARLVSTVDALKEMDRIYRFVYRAGRIPANTYRHQENEVLPMDVWDLMVVSEHLPGPLAKALTRPLFENRDSYIAAYPYMRHVALDQQSTLTTVSFHLGAQRYYAEQGLEPFARQFGAGQKKRL